MRCLRSFTSCKPSPAQSQPDSNLQAWPKELMKAGPSAQSLSANPQLETEWRRSSQLKLHVHDMRLKLTPLATLAQLKGAVG